VAANQLTKALDAPRTGGIAKVVAAEAAAFFISVTH